MNNNLAGVMPYVTYHPTLTERVDDIGDQPITNSLLAHIEAMIREIESNLQCVEIQYASNEQLISLIKLRDYRRQCGAAMGN